MVVILSVVDLFGTGGMIVRCRRRSSPRRVLGVVLVVRVRTQLRLGCVFHIRREGGRWWSWAGLNTVCPREAPVMDVPLLDRHG